MFRAGHPSVRLSSPLRPVSLCLFCEGARGEGRCARGAIRCARLDGADARPCCGVASLAHSSAVMRWCLAVPPLASFPSCGGLDSRRCCRQVGFALLRAGERAIFGHETAFWHARGAFSLRLRRSRRLSLEKPQVASKSGRTPRRFSCQSAFPWPKTRGFAASARFGARAALGRAGRGTSRAERLRAWGRARRRGRGFGATSERDVGARRRGRELLTLERGFAASHARHPFARSAVAPLPRGRGRAQRRARHGVVARVMAASGAA